FSSRRRHTRSDRDWSSDVCSSDLAPTIDEIRAAVMDAEHRAYPLKVGAISIESPVRRHDGESVPFTTMQQICGLAKEKGIGTHRSEERRVGKEGRLRRAMWRSRWT